MDDRRISPRKRTFLGAHVKYPGGSPLTECIVRDLSDTGARLSFTQPVALPSTFDLRIMKTGEVRRAEVVWSSRDSHGVRFDAEGRSTSLSASHPAYRAVQDVLETARVRIAELIGVKPAVLVLDLQFERQDPKSVH